MPAREERSLLRSQVVDKQVPLPSTLFPIFCLSEHAQADLCCRAPVALMSALQTPKHPPACPRN